MIKRCKCLIKKGIMTEFRQCRLKEKHGRSHVPDLTDMTFNNYTVLSFAGSNIHRSNYWWTIDSFGVKRKIKASNLYRGIVKGLRVPFGHC